MVTGHRSPCCGGLCPSTSAVISPRRIHGLSSEGRQRTCCPPCLPRPSCLPVIAPCSQEEWPWCGCPSPLTPGTAGKWDRYLPGADVLIFVCLGKPTAIFVSHTSNRALFSFAKPHTMSLHKHLRWGMCRIRRPASGDRCLIVQPTA